MRRLEMELQGRASIRTVPHLEPEAEAAVHLYGWRSHGAIASLNGRRIYLANDHGVSIRDLHENVLDALRLPPSCVEGTTLDLALRPAINAQR